MRVASESPSVAATRSSTTDGSRLSSSSPSFSSSAEGDDPVAVGGAVEGDDLVQQGQLGLRRRVSFATWVVVLGEDDAALGVRQDVADVVGHRRGVDGGGGDAGAHVGEVGEDPLEAGARGDPDPLLRLHPERHQPCGEPADTVAGLLPGHRLPGLTDGIAEGLPVAAGGHPVAGTARPTVIGRFSIDAQISRLRGQPAPLNFARSVPSVETDGGRLRLRGSQPSSRPYRRVVTPSQDSALPQVRGAAHSWTALATVTHVVTASRPTARSRSSAAAARRPRGAPPSRGPAPRRGPATSTSVWKRRRTASRDVARRDHLVPPVPQHRGRLEVRVAAQGLRVDHQPGLPVGGQHVLEPQVTVDQPAVGGRVVTDPAADGDRTAPRGGGAAERCAAAHPAGPATRRRPPRAGAAAAEPGGGAARTARPTTSHASTSQSSPTSSSCSRSSSRASGRRVSPQQLHRAPTVPVLEGERLVRAGQRPPP